MPSPKPRNSQDTNSFSNSPQQPDANLATRETGKTAHAPVPDRKMDQKNSFGKLQTEDRLSTDGRQNDF